jgi:hypothetical protein
MDQQLQPSPIAAALEIKLSAAGCSARCDGGRRGSLRDRAALRTGRIDLHRIRRSRGQGTNAYESTVEIPNPNLRRAMHGHPSIKFEREFARDRKPVGELQQSSE